MSISGSGETCQCANNAGECSTSNSICENKWCNWELRRVYSQPGCTGSVASQVAFVTNSIIPCSPAGCAATSFPGQSSETTCVTASPSSPPPIPANLQSQFVETQYESSTDCTGAITRQTATLTGQCGAEYRNGAFQSYRITCGTNGVVNYLAYTSNDCSGTGQTQPGNGNTVGVCTVTGTRRLVSSCPAPTTTTTTTTTLTPATTTTTTTTVSPTTTPAIVSNPQPPPSSAPCFHIDTIVHYNGKEHTFQQISSHADCSIPHVVHAVGVIIEAKCGAILKTLRLTDGHLVYTQRGLQPARDLKPNQDVVFTDVEETERCQITSVIKESHKQQYFGLNCLNSQVLANGLKASTFEKLHSVPAFWMRVVGRILGIKRASEVGDYIAELVQKMNLIN